MKQFKVFIDFKKEETYLQAMARQGYIFEKHSYFGFYHFFKKEKQTLNYRIDHRTFNNKKDLENYKTMFDDFGWKHISGNAYSGKQYFLSKSNDANADLFSSKESSANRYRRMLQMFLIDSLCLISYCFYIMECYWYNGSNFSIFDMSLWAWIPILLFLILAFVYGIGAISALKKYKAKMKDQLQ